MDLLNRNLCNNDKLGCCNDVRRSCFGKRHDAFFCYNDEKAHQGCCPSMWHPRNPTHIKIVPNFRKCDKRDKLTNGNCAEPRKAEPYGGEYYRDENYRPEHYKDESYRPELYRAEDYKDESYKPELYSAETSREQYPRDMHEFKPATFDDRPGCYCGYGMSTSKKSKKTPGLKAAKRYLKRCLLTRLTVGWTEDDDLNLAECIYHYLSKITGPNRVIEVLDEISAQRRIDSVLRSWINKLKRIFSRSRGGENLKALLTNQETFYMVPQFIGREQYHIGGGSEKYKNSFSYRPVRLSGKATEIETYNTGVRRKFNCYSKDNFALKASLSQLERASDAIPSSESTQSDENNYFVEPYNPRYLVDNGRNGNEYYSIRYANTYNGNNERNSKHEIFEQNYLGSNSVRQPLQSDNDEQPCCSCHCT